MSVSGIGASALHRANASSKSSPNLIVLQRELRAPTPWRCFSKFCFLWPVSFFPLAWCMQYRSEMEPALSSGERDADTGTLLSPMPVGSAPSLFSALITPRRQQRGQILGLSNGNCNGIQAFPSSQW